MNARSFEARPAVREQTPILFGLTGASGGGKTYSAIRAAVGICEVLGGIPFVVDTDNRRALQYADAFKKADGSPGFLHVPFEPPHGSDDYVAALRYCIADDRCGCIVIDTLSHEHAGEGGLLDFHDKEHARLGGRESTKVLAWAKPKAARNRLLIEIQRLNKPAIFTFRAKEGIKILERIDPETGRKKSEIVQQGFTPIAGDEFVFEMTLNALLMPASGGIPEWNPQEMGERKMTKLPAQFESLRGSKIPIDEELGRNLAKWARGGVKRPAAPPPPKTDLQPPDDPETSGDMIQDTKITGQTADGFVEREKDGPPRDAAGGPPVDRDAREERLAARGFSGDGLAPAGADDFPGDRPQTNAGPADGSETPSKPTADAAEEKQEPSAPGSDFGFSDLAEACALAKLWPDLKVALLKLTGGETWKAANPAMQAKARAVVFHRLAELVHEGYRFDFLDDAHAFRCYIEHEDDPNALVGNGRAFRVGSVWKDLPVAAQAQFDRAHENRLEALGYTPPATTTGDFS